MANFNASFLSPFCMSTCRPTQQEAVANGETAYPISSPWLTNPEPHGIVCVQRSPEAMESRQGKGVKDQPEKSLSAKGAGLSATRACVARPNTVDVCRRKRRKK
jgi:hypothetical protein